MDDAALIKQKSDMRRKLKALRDALPDTSRKAFSEDACQHLLDHVPLPAGQSVGLFLPIGSEIDASLLAQTLLDKGLKLALPVTQGRTGMVFRAWDPADDLIDAGFGTRGPVESAEEIVPDILILPLLGFDDIGGRLGYGAGHYDRYIAGVLSEGKKLRLIGLAFGVQQLDKVPVGRYDLPLDMIVTEQGVTTPKG